MATPQKTHKQADRTENEKKSNSPSKVNSYKERKLPSNRNNTQNILSQNDNTLIGKNFKNNTLGLLVGTFNTKYVSAIYIAENNICVKKVLIYTIKDAQNCVVSYEGTKPDIVAYQLTCN
ncbi:hypothetical protein DPMN_012809 [Dreissena polymorpha]|uniref:Uncharacterized protein n=1 Tax=Dreissena polymorpha TaxID=45954 RepID=A0A9D4N7Q8_DREPO|nr:hypothetical protein DPMN_012809 [Dreissena polymorpha]